MKLYDVVWTVDSVHVFLERVEGLELFEYLRQDDKGGRICEDEARCIAVQCLNALQVSFEHLFLRGFLAAGGSQGLNQTSASLFSTCTIAAFCTAMSN